MSLDCVNEIPWPFDSGDSAAVPTHWRQPVDEDVLRSCTALRALSLIAWLPLTVMMGVVIGLHGIASVGLGIWAFHWIKVGRGRILGWFCVGYVLGSFLGLAGTIAGAMMGALLASRFTAQMRPMVENDESALGP